MLRTCPFFLAALLTAACGSSTSDTGQGAPQTDAGTDSATTLPDVDAGADAEPAGDGGDAAPSCDYATEPELVLGKEATGRVVGLAASGGGFVFTSWRGKSYSGDSARLYRTDVVSRESQVIYEASQALSLFGANEDRIFLGQGGEYLTSVLELDHDGTVQQTFDVSTEQLGPFGLRSGKAVYAVQGGQLQKLTASGWETVTAAPGMSFVSPQTAPTPIVYDGTVGELCLLDEEQGAFTPCVPVPDSVEDGNSLYTVASAVHADGAWVLLAVTAEGTAVSVRTGDAWTPLYVTHHQSTLNGVALSGDTALWLDQKSIDQNTFETSLSSAGSTLWTVPGQAYALPDLGGCGLGLIVKNQGLYFVAKP